MKILSLRTIKRNGCWLSSWFIDGEPFCFGLCPADGRETPPGIYPVRLVISRAFSGDFMGQPMPWVDTDPTTDDYGKTTEHRLIHWGNYLENTTGCELVGYTQGIRAYYQKSDNYVDVPFVGIPRNSRECFADLYARIAPAIDTPEGVTLEIREAQPVKMPTRAGILDAIAAADVSAGGPGNASAAQIADEILKAVPTNGG